MLYPEILQSEIQAKSYKFTFLHDQVVASPVRKWSCLHRVQTPAEDPDVGIWPFSAPTVGHSPGLVSACHVLGLQRKADPLLIRLLAILAEVNRNVDTG